jgi:tripartite-type tricarboxylate transporter receptor subunit TctC
LNREAALLLARPDVRENSSGRASNRSQARRQTLAATLKSETVKWGKVIRDAGIRLQ